MTEQELDALRARLPPEGTLRYEADYPAGISMADLRKLIGHIDDLENQLWEAVAGEDI